MLHHDTAGVPESAFASDDAKLLFEVLFDITILLAEIVKLLGGDDGEEEEEIEP